MALPAAAAGAVGGAVVGGVAVGAVADAASTDDILVVIAAISVVASNNTETQPN